MCCVCALTTQKRDAERPERTATAGADREIIVRADIVFHLQIAKIAQNTVTYEQASRKITLKSEVWHQEQRKNMLLQKTNLGVIIWSDWDRIRHKWTWKDCTPNMHNKMQAIMKLSENDEKANSIHEKQESKRKIQIKKNHYVSSAENPQTAEIFPKFKSFIISERSWPLTGVTDVSLRRHTEFLI